MSHPDYRTRLYHVVTEHLLLVDARFLEGLLRQLSTEISLSTERDNLQHRLMQDTANQDQIRQHRDQYSSLLSMDLLTDKKKLDTFLALQAKLQAADYQSIEQLLLFLQDQIVIKPQNIQSIVQDVKDSQLSEAHITDDEAAKRISEGIQQVSSGSLLNAPRLPYYQEMVGTVLSAVKFFKRQLVDVNSMLYRCQPDLLLLYWKKLFIRNTLPPVAYPSEQIGISALFRQAVFNDVQPHLPPGFTPDNLWGAGPAQYPRQYITLGGLVSQLNFQARGAHSLF